MILWYCDIRSLLRLPQMPHNRLYLRLQEGVPTGVVVHAFQLIDQHRTTVYPSYEGFYCAVGRVGWLVEQGEFRLAVASWCKHFEWWVLSYEWLMSRRRTLHVSMTIETWSIMDSMMKQNKDTKYRLHKQVLDNLFHFYSDKNGHKRTKTDIANHGCIIFAMWFRNHPQKTHNS